MRVLRLLLVLSFFAAPALARGPSPGVFSYWVLSLSWSPEYCASDGRGDPEQCGARRYGLVAHGLWPQNERGFPEFCGRPAWIDEAVMVATLPVMPSRKLILHEWKKHGTCSGLSPGAYFARVRELHGGVRIPASLRQPLTHVEVRPAALKSQLLAGNPGLTSDAVILRCGGSYLREIRICYDRAMKPRACGADLRDNCRRPTLILRPLR